MRSLKSVFSDRRHSSEHVHFILLSGSKEIINGEASFKIKLEAFYFCKSPFRMEKVTSVRSWVTWVQPAGICRRLDECSEAELRPLHWQSEHLKPVMRDESFRFMRERASNLLYRPTTTTFCLAPVRTQHVLHLASRFWRKYSACALGFSRSNPEWSHLEVYVYPLSSLFFSKRWSVEALWTFPQTIFFVFKGFEKGPACVQIKTTRGGTFQTKHSEKCKGHAIYGIVTVYRAMTVYRAWHISESTNLYL